MLLKARAAVSGQGNAGMPAWFRIDAPAATSSPPIQLASTGLPALVPWAFTKSAVRVGSIIAWGVKITSRPSVFGSLATTSSAWA